MKYEPYTKHGDAWMKPKGFAKECVSVFLGKLLNLFTTILKLLLF